MLDAETKRKIDNARDILVGKVPDPKSQVEQITIALIYKFMDDMDRESEELGGKASFFSGEYKKYSWSKIFDPKLGGYDLITLYGEAIAKMNTNKKIPQLFRDIFKNAFLPYRDPETLKSFLKEINDFHYNHSEKLGDAFEYLLSVLGSQGEAGQFRTPRHIIDFIVAVVDPKKGETVLDPAGGTAGFLISSYKHILKTNTSPSMLKAGNNGNYAADLLTPDDRKRIMESFEGYDISPDMVRLSLANLYLHGFPSPRIHEYDTLTSEDRWGETFDVILANPPFMTPKGGIRPHKRFSIQANRSEVLFVDYIAEHLSTSGRAGVIVPEGIIFQSANAYKSLRKMLIEQNYLWAVVSLPAGVFNPYSGVKTSILFMDKALAKKTNDVLFIKIDHDGFDLGAQRRPNGKDDLPTALDVLRKYKKSLSLPDSINDVNALIVSKSRIAEKGDYNLSVDRYRETIVHSHHEWPMVKLDDVCEINPKKTEVKELPADLMVSFLPMEDLNENRIAFHPQKEGTIGKLLKSYTYFRDNDVLLARVTPCFENGKSGIAKNLLNGIGFGSSEYTVIRPSYKILSEFVYRVISSNKFKELGKIQMTGTGGLQRLSMSFIKDYKFPLPPLEVQKEIVAEIEVYQKIIDGARQVVENWKPSFSIDPDWPLVELGAVCEKISNGVNFTKEQVGKGVRFINIKDLFSDCYIDVTNLERVDLSPKEIERNRVKSGDILFVRSSVKYEGVGYPSIFLSTDDDPIVFCGFIIRASLNKSIVVPEYLLFLLRTVVYRNKTIMLSNKANITNISQDNLISLLIPLPPIEVQNEIVTKIQEEQKLIDYSKRLIEIHEAKIKSKIDVVWGS